MFFKLIFQFYFLFTGWALSTDPLDLDISYRIHYKHQQFTDVKTISQSDPAYILKVTNSFRNIPSNCKFWFCSLIIIFLLFQGLEPYTQYEIWVEAIVNGSSSPASDHVSSSLIQFDPVWSNMIQFDPIWSNMIQFDSFWSNMIQFDPVWSNLIQFDPIRSNLIQYDPIWSSLIQFEPF